MSNNNTKTFKSRRMYYRDSTYYILFLSLSICCLWYTLVTPEQEFVAMIMNRETTGSIRQIRNIMIQKFLVSNWGKAGMQVFIAITTLLLANELYETISEYRRMIFREKLIREGLRAPDDYVDDYVRVPFWKKIVNLFSSKRKKSYPSEREMREALKKNKYYKGE